MRKFTKLISESKEDEFKQHPLMNPLDWEEIDDLSEDIKDVCGKMKMFPKVNYTISLFFKSWHPTTMEHINIVDGDVVGVNKNLDEKLSDFNISDLNRILISIYNNKTAGDDFIPKKYL